MIRFVAFFRIFNLVLVFYYPLRSVLPAVVDMYVLVHFKIFLFTFLPPSVRQEIKELSKLLLLCPEQILRVQLELFYRDKLNNWAQRLINLEIPVLVRSLKSSNVELG